MNASGKSVRRILLRDPEGRLVGIEEWRPAVAGAHILKTIRRDVNGRIAEIIETGTEDGWALPAVTSVRAEDLPGARAQLIAGATWFRQICRAEQMLEDYGTDRVSKLSLEARVIAERLPIVRQTAMRMIAEASAILAAAGEDPVRTLKAGSPAVECAAEGEE
jgi:hypothetical protein